LEGSELWHLEEFKYRLESKVNEGVDALNACFVEELESLKQRQDSAAKAQSDAQSASTAAATAAAAAQAAKKVKAAWTVKETTTLIKAVKMYPAGTVSRWEKIAEYINLHGIEDGEPTGIRERGPEECIKKAKEVQGVTIAERAAMQQAAAAAATAKKKEVEIKEAPSARGDFGTVVEDAASTAAKKVVGTKASTASLKASAASAENKENNKATAKTATTTNNNNNSSNNAAGGSGFVLPENDTWTSEQQAALEAGLRKFPASQFSANPSDRWEKIASEVPGKSKKEVKQRVKDLADAIKKKNKK
jgi:DnaJ family protein C protein 2